MYLYEKNKDKIDVYELKEKRDKLFEFKMKKMSDLWIDSIVYSLKSNNKEELVCFRDNIIDEKSFIEKKNYIFKHKTGIKLNNVIHCGNNGLIIDGLLHRLCRGDFDFYTESWIKEINIENVKYLLLTSFYIDQNKTKLFDAESYKYSIDNVISIPESIYLLLKLRQHAFDKIADKNLDEQLSLYDFVDTPIKKLDLETLKFTNQNTFTDRELEINQNILKKVRQINK